MIDKKMREVLIDWLEESDATDTAGLRHGARQLIRELDAEVEMLRADKSVLHDEVCRLRRESTGMNLQVGVLHKALLAMKAEFSHEPDEHQWSLPRIGKAIEEAGLSEKPNRDGLCSNDRDGEKCLKLAGHEGICEGPQHVWDLFGEKPWKPTLGRTTDIEKRVDAIVCSSCAGGTAHTLVSVCAACKVTLFGEKLRHDHATSPCPRCGRVQPDVDKRKSECPLCGKEYEGQRTCH